MNIEVPVSLGELLDKISILEIKKQQGFDGVEAELQLLRERLPKVSVLIERLYGCLHETNIQIWNNEDDKRDHEKEKNFDDRFVQCARAVYILNDLRADIKKKINILGGSNIQEYKSYGDYLNG